MITRLGPHSSCVMIDQVDQVWPGLFQCAEWESMFSFYVLLKGAHVSVGSKHVCMCIYVGSVGKSTLLTMLTGTQSEAAAYEFTTLTCIPGIIHYNDAKIQLLDLPGIIEGASEGKGRGRQVGNIVTKSLILQNVFFSS